MREIQLDESKEILFEGLKYFAEFCEIKGLRYYLAYGTLLGAVRHQGFIPWDDDVDVWMPRPDYDKLLFEYYNEICNEEWELNSEETQQDYYNDSAKLSNRETIIKPNRFQNNFLYGLSIDIFPLDTISSTIDKDEFKDEFFRIANYYRRRKNLYFMIRRNHSKWQQIVNEILHFIVFKLFPNKCHEIHNSWSQKLREVDYSKTTWLSSFIESKCVYKKEWFDDDCRLVFENTYFRVPKCYDKVLSERYGCYMQLPPEKERIPKHNYKAYHI